MAEPTPQPVAVPQGPSALELLWERHNRTFQGVFWLLALGLLLYYGYQYYERRQVDAKWSAFAAAIGLDKSYVPVETEITRDLPYDILRSWLGEVKSTDPASLQAFVAAADTAQRPYALWVLANHAARNGDWDSAQRFAAQLRADFPKHPLSESSAYPVQVRASARTDEIADPKKPKPSEPELQPVKEGAMVDLLLQQAAEASSFKRPEAWGKPTIPADAPRYRIKLAGDWGEFVVALMVAAAPKHCEAFEKLAKAEHWKGMKVDEIWRPSPKSHWSDGHLRFHFGFSSTRLDNRADWQATEPSEHLVSEVTGLSHFPGAVSARAKDGKSELDHLWVSATDGSRQDGQMQVFAYVVESDLEKVRRVCEAQFSTEDEADRGFGPPADAIAIESVTKVD